ncbi:MAG: hypothetical protein HGA40_05405 [Methanoregulaceae archaeon]|nr:hypothetical protein [Methanoregulaceae archaeon]
MLTCSQSPRLRSGMTYLLRRDGCTHVISENYSYKTETYYLILSRELNSEPVAPDSRSVLDAYVVPVCLERASRAGVPVAECLISQSCGRIPAVFYGLNYFSCSSEFSVVRTPDAAKEVIRHITNSGKYPFCFQPLDENATLVTAHAIFGKCPGHEQEVGDYSELIYREFRIPLVSMIFIKSDGTYRLSSLAPARYSALTPGEKSLLRAYLAHQEFL